MMFNARNWIYLKKILFSFKLKFLMKSHLFVILCISVILAGPHSDCPDCDYEYTAEEIIEDLVVDKLENIDKKFPLRHDPIGMEKPQWVIDLDAKNSQDEADTDEGIEHEEF